MSDNEAEQEGNPPGALAGTEEQPVIAHPQVVLPNIRPVPNFQVTPPEKFLFKPEEWPKWIQRFERFRKATGLDKQTGENQVNTLIYTMGEQADDIFISFEFTAEQEKNYEEVKEKFDNHGETKETSKRSRKTSLKRNLPTAPKRKILINCQRCLGKLHPKKTCLARFSKCNKCSKIGHWAQACKSSKP